MSATEIDIRYFNVIPEKVVGKFSHKVDKGTLTFSTKTWFRKESNSPSDARLECLALEFFRLIIPTQPQTYIAKHPSLTTYYTLSEEIPGYRELPFDEQINFNAGHYFGLGQIVLGAIFLQEIDFNTSNVGLNIHNQVVKIDGDWCFANIQEPGHYKNKTMEITPLLIESLPYPRNYYSYNWLDIKKKGVMHASHKIVDPVTLASQPHFRLEINQAMLKILLLPGCYLQKLVDAIMPVSVEADIYLKFLCERRDHLKIHALQNASFQAYLLSPATKEDTKQHLIHMKRFMINGLHNVVDAADHDELEHEYHSLHSELLALATASVDIPTPHKTTVLKEKLAFESSKTSVPAQLPSCHEDPLARYRAMTKIVDLVLLESRTSPSKSTNTATQYHADQSSLNSAELI